jgi:hypothetical protein
MIHLTPVHKERIAIWVKSLRSGEYQQNIGALREFDKFCCLGVACDLSLLAEWESVGTEGRNKYMGDISIFHERVANYYGIDERPKVNYLGKPKNLVSLNDSGKTFLEIADLIEQTYL